MLNRMLTRTTRSLAEPPKPDGRPNVDNMIRWLWHDGFYKGLVGWRTDAALEDIKLPSGRLTPERKWYNEPRLEDFDTQASYFPEKPFPPEFVEEMVERHGRLIPKALELIDQLLLDAGVQQEEVDQLSKGQDSRQSEAYAKLDRLVDARRTIPPERMVYRVVFGKLDGRWLSQELALEASCTLAGFDRRVREHGLITWEGTGVDTGMSIKNERTSQSLWLYKLVPSSQSTIETSDQGWTGLDTAEHFESVKESLIREKTKTVLMCHEETLRCLMLADPEPKATLEPYRILFGPQSGEVADDQDMIFRIETETEADALKLGFDVDPETAAHRGHYGLKN
ncbi:hypothetical protein MaudMau93_005649 [Microsporum audouinii]